MIPTTLLTLLLISACLASAEQGNEKGRPIELNPESLAELEKESKGDTKRTYLLLFYAPWCPYCQRIMPTYAEAAQQLPRKFPDLFVGQIDASKYRSEGNRFGVRGYPSIYHLANGETYKFHGQRTVDDFGNFVEETRRKKK